MREPRLQDGLRPSWSTSVPLGLARWCGWCAVVVVVLAAALLVQWGNRYYVARTLREVEEPSTSAGYDAVYSQLAVAHDTLMQAVVALLTVGALLGIRGFLRRTVRGTTR